MERRRLFVKVEVERNEDETDMFVMLEEGEEGELVVSLTNCCNAWTSRVLKDEKPRVESDKDKSLVDLVKRYLGGSSDPKGKYKMKRIGGNLTFVIEFNNFMMATLKLTEAQNATVMQVMLGELIKRDEEMRRLEANEREMRETIDQLNATIDQRVDTEIRIQDELALQFLQVLNRKKDYSAKLEKEFEELKADKGSDKGVEGGHGGKEAVDVGRAVKKKGAKRRIVLSDIEEDEEEEDEMFKQFHA